MSDTFLSATGDGLVRNAIVKSGNTWSGCRSAGSGTFATYTDTNATFCEASNDGWGDSKYYIDRGFLAFDTSALPDNALLTGATLSIWVTGVNSSAGGSFVPVEGTQASTSSLATSDFGAVGSTEFASRQNFSGCPTGQYVDFALNASGLAAINLTGYTKFAFRASFDIDNSAPTNGTLSYITVDLADFTGTSHDPKLVVSYVVPVTASDTVGVSDSGSAAAVADPKSASDTIGVSDTGGALVAIPMNVTPPSDSFTGTNGTELTSHTLTTGESWLGGYFYATGTQIQGNRVRGVDSSDTICPVNAVMGSPDYSVAADVYFASNALESAGVIGRWLPATTEGYVASLTKAGALTLYRYGGAGFAPLDTYAAGTRSAGVAYNVRLEMIGTAIKVYLDGTQRISVTETSITSAGSPGIRISAAGNFISEIDNFAVTGLSVPAGGAETVTLTESASNDPSGGANYKSASDTVTVTESASVDTGFALKTASDTVSVADSAAATVQIRPGLTYSGTVSQGSTPPQVVQAASGASDGLNYNAFPGMAMVPALGAPSSRSDVLTPANVPSTAELITNNGFCITSAGTYLACSPSASGEFFGAVDRGFWIARSTNQGSTWTRTKISVHSGGDSAIWQVPVGMPNAGRIYATRTNYYVAGYEEGVAHNLMQYSDDDGVTWSAIATSDHWTVTGGAPPWVVATSTGKWTLCAAPAIPSANGTDLLLPTYRRTLNSMDDLDFFVVVRKSSDGGDTWSDHGTSPFPYSAGYRFEEPTLTYREDGALLCAARVATPVPAANVWMNISYDDGLTWGTPRHVFGAVGATLGSGEFYTAGRATIHTASNGMLVMLQRCYTTASGSTIYTTSVDGFNWAAAKDISGGAVDLVPYPGGAGTDKMSMYGAFANDTNGDLVCVYSVEYSTNVGGVYMRKMVPAANKLILAYHHANDHTATGTGKINAQVGTSDGSGGYTWGSVTTLATTSGVNSCDVGCVTLGNGDVMVTWNESSTPGHANVNTVVNWKYRKTSDQGATYATAVSQAVPGWATTVTAGSGGGAYAAAPCKPIRLRNGDLLMATYGWDNRAIEDGGGSFSSREYVKCVKSTDQGATWSVVGTIFPDTVGTAYDETDLLLLDNGTILAACRHIHTGLNIVTSRSTDDGATWSSPVLALGTDTSSSGDGYGGRPDLIQTESGGVLLRVRYMNGVNSSWPEYRLSVDRGVTWGAQVDPYTGSAHTLGTTPSSPRGMDIYGAFAPTSVPNVVAYVWSEEVPFSSVAALYFRLLTVTVTETSQAESFTVNDSAGVSVGVGAIAKTASDGFNVTDTSGGLTVTFRKSASDTVTVTDSSGTSTTTEPVKYALPVSANFVSASGHTADFVSARSQTADFVSSPSTVT